MEYVVGVVLALATALLGRVSGFDRDRSFYAVVLVVVAAYYDLFAVMGGERSALYLETLAFFVFVVMSVIGFRTNLWIVAGALLGHGLFDLVHGRLVANPGVPEWWPVFCLAYDGAAAGLLAWLLLSGRLDARRRRTPGDAAGTVKPVAAPRVRTGLARSAALLVGAIFGTGACSTAPSDVRVAQVGEHEIAYRVLGSGRPVLVMLSGLGDGMATFEDVAADMSGSATVILYDRPGYGGSDMAGGARDAAAVERELSAVLEQSGVPGPYVLAGHSLGGLFAEYYAASHPDQVSALILEESRPADFTHRCEAAGLSPCEPPVVLRLLMSEGARGEAAVLAATADEVEAAGPVEGKPVLVMSRPVAPGAPPFEALWATAQADLAARYPGARHLTAHDGGHYVHDDQRDWYVGAVREFLGGLEPAAAN